MDETSRRCDYEQEKERRAHHFGDGEQPLPEHRRPEPRFIE